MSVSAHDHLVVDGANVVGARPDGWWRDRAGAAQRLAARLAAALDGGMLDSGVLQADVVHLVLEGAAKAATIPAHPRLLVVRAPADGDGTIVALAAELATGTREPLDVDDRVTVVTADRGLRDRLAAGPGSCRTVGPGTLLARLP